MRPPQCAGLVQKPEGLRLAQLASDVPQYQAIVEIGTHTGLSTCWMAEGSERGRGAHITAVDPWAPPRPGTQDDPFGLVDGDGVYRQFAKNLADEHHWGTVTPLRARSIEAAGLWVQPVGLVFIDAIHEYDAVRRDYLAWEPHVPVGGWIAFHDYTEDPAHEYYGVAAAVNGVVVPSGNWGTPEVTEYLWTARRVA
ncbi:MAG TPA: class I SAM-dependent methyltransferase [Actinomycetota bacterium]